MLSPPIARIIKKYRNRRLYDLFLSQYIKIEDLQAYVLEQIPFQVIDAETKVDITDTILLQILIDLQNTKAPFLSAELLRQFILLSQNPMNQIFLKYLEEIFASLDKGFIHNSPLNPEWEKTSQEWVTQWQNLMSFKPKI